MGRRKAMIARVSSAARDSRLRSVTSWNLRRRASNSGRVTKRQPPATFSSRPPRSAWSVFSASASSARATDFVVASRRSPRSLSRTGRGDENRTASRAGSSFSTGTSRRSTGASATSGGAAVSVTASLAVSIAYLVGGEHDLRPRRVDLGKGARLEGADHAPPDQLQTGEKRRDGFGSIAHLAQELEQRHRPLLVQPRQQLQHLVAHREAQVVDGERRRVRHAVVFGDGPERLDQVEQRDVERLLGPVAAWNLGLGPRPQTPAQRVDRVQCLGGTLELLVLEEPLGKIGSRILLGRTGHAGQ